MFLKFCFCGYISLVLFCSLPFFFYFVLIIKKCLKLYLFLPLQLFLAGFLCEIKILEKNLRKFSYCFYNYFLLFCVDFRRYFMSCHLVACAIYSFGFYVSSLITKFLILCIFSRFFVCVVVSIPSIYYF